MFKDKRGQAAMEFLMTYGWAILAAIIVIGVLAIYFRPGQLTSDSVVVTAPFYGVGTTISTSTVQVEVRNNGGETVTITSVALSPCTTNTTSIALSSGSTQVLTLGSCGLTSGDTFNGDLTISYIRPGSSLTLQSTGSVSGSVA